MAKAFQFTPEKENDDLDSQEGIGIKDINGNDLERCRSFSVNNINYKKKQFYELSKDYYIKVLETLKNDNGDFFLFGRSFEGAADPLTGVLFCTPWVPEHLVLCHIKNFSTRVYDREKNFFDTDQQHRPLLSYPFCPPDEYGSPDSTDVERVALFF